MNITDIDQNDLAGSIAGLKELRKRNGILCDMLELLFEAQKKLKEKYDEIEKKKGFFVPDHPVNVNDTLVQGYLKDLYYRIVTELVESSECLKNKPWKMSEMPTDVDHLKEELADAFHFFLELCINLGISAEELFILYFRKNKVNQWRQETNY